MGSISRFVWVLWLSACAAGVEPGPDTPQSPVNPDPDPGPEALVFSPGFHQALRWSTDFEELTTVEMRVPVGRSGKRLKFVFRAGDSALTIERATVASLVLSFGGQEGVVIEPQASVSSDPLPLEVIQGTDLSVSFEVKGAAASSAISAFPGSSENGVAVGLTTIEVEGPPSRSGVAIGDSITEGYIHSLNDTRQAWPHLVQKTMSFAVANAGVSGQGVVGALEHLDDEVLQLNGITDCFVLVGTNDLENKTDAEITGFLQELFTRLKPFCRVWGGALPPKLKAADPEKLDDIKARRKAVNDWIRSSSLLEGVFAFDQVLADADDPDAFAEGYSDGSLVHPNAAGHQRMAEEASSVLSGSR